MTNEERVQKAEDKLLEMTTEMNKLVDFLPRLLVDDSCSEKEFNEEITQILKAQCEYFKFIHESGFDCAGLISYYDHGLEWLEHVRLLEFTSYSDSTMDIHECVTKIISLDIDIAMLIHLVKMDI